MLFTSTYGVSTHDFWNLELRHHHDVDTNVFILLFLLIVCYYQKRGVSFFLTKRFSFVLHFLLQKYSFSFKLQTFCREILRFNTILSSSAPFSPLSSHVFSTIPYYIQGERKRKNISPECNKFPNTPLFIQRTGYGKRKTHPQDMPVLKSTNNKKYYSNLKIHAYEASIYTKENETFGSDHLLHQADSLLLSYHGAKWEAKGVLS